MSQTRYTWKLTGEGNFGFDLPPDTQGKPRGCHHFHNVIERAFDCPDAIERASDCPDARSALIAGYGIVALKGGIYRPLRLPEHVRIADYVSKVV